MRLSLAIPLTIVGVLAAAAAAGAKVAAAGACKTGSRADNIAVARNFYRAYNSGDGALLGRTLADNFRSEPVTPNVPIGPQGAIDKLKVLRATFAPLNIENVEFITQGNKVVVRSEITATHSGPFVGLAPTGKTLKFGAIDILTICGGKIVHGHHQEGWLAALTQLGVIPLRK